MPYTNGKNSRMRKIRSGASPSTAGPSNRSATPPVHGGREDAQPAGAPEQPECHPAGLPRRMRHGDRDPHEEGADERRRDPGQRAPQAVTRGPQSRIQDECDDGRDEGEREERGAREDEAAGRAACGLRLGGCARLASGGRGAGLGGRERASGALDSGVHRVRVVVLLAVARRTRSVAVAGRPRPRVRAARLARGPSCCGCSLMCASPVRRFVVPGCVLPIMPARYEARSTVRICTPRALLGAGSRCDGVRGARAPVVRLLSRCGGCRGVARVVDEVGCLPRSTGCRGALAAEEVRSCRCRLGLGPG